MVAYKWKIQNRGIRRELSSRCWLQDKSGLWNETFWLVRWGREAKRDNCNMIKTVRLENDFWSSILNHCEQGKLCLSKGEERVWLQWFTLLCPDQDWTSLLLYKVLGLLDRTIYCTCVRKRFLSQILLNPPLLTVFTVPTNAHWNQDLTDLVDMQILLPPCFRYRGCEKTADSSISWVLISSFLLLLSTKDTLAEKGVPMNASFGCLCWCSETGWSLG